MSTSTNTAPTGTTAGDVADGNKHTLHIQCAFLTVGCVFQAPAPSPRTEALRNAIKSAELDAERIELATLADMVQAEFPVLDEVDPARNLCVALSHFADGPLPEDAPITRLINATTAINQN